MGVEQKVTLNCQQEKSCFLAADQAWGLVRREVAQYCCCRHRWELGHKVSTKAQCKVFKPSYARGDTGSVGRGTAVSVIDTTVQSNLDEDMVKLGTKQ